MTHIYIVIGLEREDVSLMDSRAFHTMSEAIQHADDNYPTAEMGQYWGRLIAVQIWEYCINTDDEPNVYSRKAGEWARD